MLDKAFTFIVLTFVFAVYGFGQKVETASKSIAEPCQPTQIHSAEKTQTVVNNGFRAQTFALRNLMPLKNDAWIVKIVTTGGFTGQGLPTITVSSDGDMFIEDENSSGERVSSGARKKLSADVLKQIAEIIYAQSSPENEQKALAETESINAELKNLCSDCYQTSITVGRRDASGEIEFFTNRSKNILFSVGDFNRIRRIISENIAL